MSRSRQIISISCIITGVLLVIAGLICIGVYVVTVSDVWSEPDRSPIFWYLVFVFAGLILIATGTFFIITGIRAYRDEESELRKAGYALGIFGTFLLLLITSAIYSEWSADRRRSEMQQHRDRLSKLGSTMHTISNVEISDFNDRSFSFRIATSGKIRGTYSLRTKISSSQADFIESVEEITLDPGNTELTRHVTFERLFRKCFSEFRGKGMYECIENTEAQSFFTIELELAVVKSRGEPVTDSVYDDTVLKSTGKAEFRTDTYAQNQTVTVKNFRPVESRH